MASTFGFFHAHPDDEAIATGGVMAQLADAGHRVVLVVATRGEHGEVPAGVLRPGEELWERRVAETHAAAAILGVERVEFLGYRDSGMMDAETNSAPDSFWSTDVEEAAERLASVLREEDAHAVTAYDERGGYGHPDHIQVHRVGLRAAALAGTPAVFESTVNADHVTRMIREAAGTMEFEETDLGVPEARITTFVDVTDVIERKRAAMVAHASQITEESFFLQLPPDLFRRAFGTEWFIRHGAPAGTREASLHPRSGRAGPRT